jgi:hypothetical protein
VLLRRMSVSGLLRSRLVGRVNKSITTLCGNGVGTFYANDDTEDGKPVRTRLLWSEITPTSGHWEQAESTDGGKTWETDWIMDLKRVR